jgi:septum formation protein
MSPFALKPEYTLVLGSGSPRRKELLEAVGLEFTVRTSDADETAPSNLTDLETVQFVAEQKAKDLLPSLRTGEVLLCADTEVWQNGERFGKPADRADALRMLQRLAGSTHRVISAVCATDGTRWSRTHCITEIEFHPLPLSVLEHYVDTYRPFDKAGAWGAQEFIGYVGIKSLNGSYTNVVGLPVPEALEALRPWCAEPK